MWSAARAARWPRRVRRRRRPSTPHRGRSRRVLQGRIPQQLALARDQRGDRFLPRAPCELDESPGASWPASGRSAEMTWPIFGYPPAVCRSAINRIGSPAAGHLNRAHATGSEISSSLPQRAPAAGLRGDIPCDSNAATRGSSRPSGAAAHPPRNQSACGPGRTRRRARPLVGSVRPTAFRSRLPAIDATIGSRSPAMSARPRDRPCG